MAVLLAVAAGCTKDIGTPESAAEKYLNDLSGDLQRLGFYSAVSHDYFRSPALMLNEQADSIISGGYIPTLSELSDKYFKDDKVFYRWKFIEMSVDSIKQYEVWDFTEMIDAEKETRLDLLEKGHFGKLIKQTDVTAVVLEYENIPLYTLRYKIDSRHIDFKGEECSVASVGVIKHPEYGYRVVSFMWN